MTTRNAVTGDPIRTHPSTKAFRENYDAVFIKGADGVKPQPAPVKPKIPKVRPDPKGRVRDRPAVAK